MERFKTHKPRLHTARGKWGLLGPAARRMRREPTQAEHRLWQRLRRHGLGVLFRRQHVIDRFIVDFLCIEANLVIEVDGPVHEQRVAEDRVREEHLRACGYRVLRFSNEQVETDLDRVVDQIRSALAPSPSHQGEGD